MPRPPATDRLPDLVRTAGDVFLARGYRRTQMSDVTQAMGLSSGAIYRWVESKEALFDLVLRCEADPAEISRPRRLPLATPAPGSTLAFLARLLAEESRLPVLRAALETRSPANLAAEVAAIAREVFRSTARHQRGLRIVERSALDWPELSELWWGRARAAVIELLSSYVRRRCDAGLFRGLPDPDSAARVVTEVAAYFAMHRHYDPHPSTMNEVTAESLAVTAIVRTFVCTEPLPIEESRS